MGYRSDVAYIIRVKTIKTKEFIALAKLKGLGEALDECAVEAEGNEVDFSFYAGGVKWYESYEDVQMHEALLQFVGDEFNEHAGYRFIRIGEDDEDVDTKIGGSESLDPWENFYISREIHIPFSILNKPSDVTVR